MCSLMDKAIAETRATACGILVRGIPRRNHLSGERWAVSGRAPLRLTSIARQSAGLSLAAVVSHHLTSINRVWGALRAPIALAQQKDLCATQAWGNVSTKSSGPIYVRLVQRRDISLCLNRSKSRAKKPSGTSLELWSPTPARTSATL